LAETSEVKLWELEAQGIAVLYYAEPAVAAPLMGAADDSFSVKMVADSEDTGQNLEYLM
jgi:hypothetical protein